MKTRRNRLPLFPVAIIIGMLLMTGLQQGARAGNKGSAQEMEDYVHNLYPGSKDIRIQCMGYDSDRDGYVRCTSVFEYKEKETKLEAECAYAPDGDCGPGTYTSGCGPVKTRVNNYE